MKRPRFIRNVGGLVLEAALLALLLATALVIVRLSLQRPWDTETYWYAAKAALQGLNPYDPAHLARLAHRPFGMPYLYPPITLPLFMPLTLLPVITAAEAWLVAKVVLLFVLLQVWRRRFLPGLHPAVLTVAAVFGFNAAVVWDLKTGNIAILEEILLWTGFAGYAAGRRRLFAGCMVAAALFKLLPILCLALLWIPARRGRTSGRLALGALAVWAGLAFLPALIGPAWARDFLHLAPADRPLGTAGPSALGLIDMLQGDRPGPLVAPPYRTLFLWAGYAAVLVGLSVAALRRAWRRGHAVEWVMVAAVLYVLLTPRMTAYSYLLAVVPCIALTASAFRRIGGGYAVAALISAQAVLARVFRFDYREPWLANLPFLLLLGLWLAYVFVGSRGEPVKRR
jgi:Glycosyltransferase family 87